MKRVAIVGTGIAGMACARELHGKFDLTIYEKNDYVGGHTNTVTVDEDGVGIPIDTGFMVYNEATYPNLTKLFQKLGVRTKPTSMSFSVQHRASGLEFAGTGLGGLFAQSRNFFRPSHWKLLTEINRFNSTCEEVLTAPQYQSMTIDQYLSARGYSEDFRDRYLVPMSAAVWSSPPTAMLEFPVVTLVRFFSNHRFLGLHGQLAWRTVVGGSKNYRDLLIQPFGDKIRTRTAATRIKRLGERVEVTDVSGTTQSYDAVVVAAHADESLQLLAEPTPMELKVLSAFQYQKNVATLHTDSNVMPTARRAWAAWNYRVDADGPSTIYWMNRLQEVSKKKDYFVSINGHRAVHQDRVLRVIDYQHPLYTCEAIEAQRELPGLNESGPIYFCGSYFRYGFHEDALSSGLDAAQAVLKGRS